MSKVQRSSVLKEVIGMSEPPRVRKLIQELIHARYPESRHWELLARNVDWRISGECGRSGSSAFMACRRASRKLQRTNNKPMTLGTTMICASRASYVCDFGRKVKAPGRSLHLSILEAQR